MSRRNVWLTDRYGAEVDDATLDRLDQLLDTVAVPDGDDEHRSVSVTDEDSWNLEFSAGRVILENVEVGGAVVGTVRGATRNEELAIAGELLRGDLEALRSRDWR